MDPDAKTNLGFTAWDLMKQRVDADEVFQSDFQNLMAALNSKRIRTTYFDALEKVPHAAPKLLEQVGSGFRRYSWADRSCCEWTRLTMNTNITISAKQVRRMVVIIGTMNGRYICPQCA